MKHFVSFFCLACSFGLARAETPFPTTPGTIWHYQVSHEFGEGSRPSDESLKFDAQGKLHTSTDTYLAGRQRVGEVDTFKYDTYGQGTIVMTEFLAVDEKGVTIIARSAEKSEPLLCVPPQKVLSFPPRVKEKWTYKGNIGDMETEQEYEIVGQESVQVPAGKFDVSICESRR